MRISRALVCAALGFVLIAPEARTQERAQDESPVERARIGLKPSAELHKHKRERAKEGRWAWTFLGMFAAGYDSNIYETPGSGPTPIGSPGEESSGVYDLGVKVTALRYFSDRDQLRLSFATTGSPNLEDSDITEYRQVLRARYTARMSKRLRFSVSGSVKHDNDSEVDAFGGSLSRDYENFAYRVSPSVRYRLGKGQSLRLSFPVKRKDYKETTLNSSLDWWEAGSALTYKGSWRRASVELGYAFVVRNYDEELASLADGTLLATNPEEEHRYHKLALELGWRVSDNLELFGGYRFKSKDDRFQGFESYDDRRWELGLAATPRREWALRAKLSYGQRDYDKRLGDLPTEELEYDKLSASFLARYVVSSQLSLFANYSFSERDSNRSTGTSYRDYDTHRFFTGVSYGY